VPRFFPSFGRSRPEEYDLRKLIDQRILGKPAAGANRHLVCDIDKTYLETEFESLVKMAKIPFEGARDKVTVRGASDVLRAFRWGADASVAEGTAAYPQHLHFVSSSPPQLRRVLEQKLALDGLDWTSDTFKDQVYNLRKGRFDQLKQQAAYKSAAILRLLQACAPGSEVAFVGDNAESDPYIYLGLKLLAEGFLDASSYRRYLKCSGIEDRLADTVSQMAETKLAVKVRGIFIRLLPSGTLRGLDPLTNPVLFFNSFLEVGLYLAGMEFIEVAAIWPMVRDFHNRLGMSRTTAIGILAQAREHFSGNLGLVASVSDALERLDPRWQPIAESFGNVYRVPCFRHWPETDGIDPVSFFSQVEMWTQGIARERGEG
jgi:hypothetical protein